MNEDDNNQKTDPAWRATHNAIAVGASATDSDTATVTRQITGVAAGTYDTDAVNVAQLKAATVDLDNIQGINRRRNEEDDGFNTTIEGTFSVWDDGRFGTSNFAVDKDGAFNAAGGKFSVDENGNTTAAGTLSAGATTVSELTVGEKNRTVELITDGEVTDGDAGAGYVKGSTVYSAMNTKLGDYAKLDGTNLDAAYAEAWGAIGTGAVESGNGKLVTGDTVYSAMNTTLGDYAKLNGSNLDTAYAEAWGAIGTGAVESGNGKLVTGDTVYSAMNTTLGDYAKLNGSNLDTAYAEAWGAIGTGAVESGNGKLVTGDTVYSAMSTTLGDYAKLNGSNLDTAYAEAWGAIGTGAVESGNGKLVTGDTVYSAMSTTLGDYAKLNGSNLDTAYAEAWGAIGTGAVESGNGKLVTGDTVFAVTNALSDRIGTIASDGNYISASGSVSENLISLDNQVKANTSDITVAALNEGSYGYISAGHDVAGNLIALDNAVKANAGAIQGVERTGNATDGFTTTIEGKLSVSSNGAFSISGDKFTVDSNGAISAAGGKFTVGADGTLSAKATTVSELTVGDSGKVTVGSATLNTDGLAIGTAASLSATGLTVGNTTVTNTGLAISGGPSVTSDGIDAGGKKITNVLKGEAGTDAVTVEQLHEAFDAFTTTGGTALGFGKGIAKNNDILEVNAGEGLTFADNGALKVNAGDGLMVDTSETTANKNALKVNAGGGLTIVDGALKVNAGEGLTIDTENGNALKVDKIALTGTIETENAGFVTGGDVHSALALKANTDLDNISDTGKAAVRGLAKDSVKVVAGTNTSVTTGTDGDAITYAVNVTSISSGNITDDVKLGAADSSITVGSLKTSVATNTNDISTLKSTVSGHTDSISALDETVNNANSGLVKKVADNAGNISDLQNTVGNASSGLVKDVSTLQATVGNASSGLVKDVSSLQTTVGGHTTAIGEINTSITGINSSISSLSTGKANVDLDNISDTGKAAVRGLAKESVKVVAGTYTTVDQGTDGNADAYTVSVTADGVVDSNNTGLVTGGAVYSALQAYQPDGEIAENNGKAVSGGTVFNALSAYAKSDGATLSNATLTGATISSGSIADEVKLGGADSTITVGSLKTSVADNTSKISALQTTIGDTESGLIKDVADNKKAITTTGITFTGDTGTSGAVKLDGTLAVNGDSNITTEATDGKVAIKLKNSIDLGNEGSMTIGNATLNTSGLVISGGPSVTSDGIAAGNKKITGVAEGVNDTDAVNKAQMDSELAKVSAGAVYSGGDGVAISDDRKISLKNGKGLAFADGTLVVNNGDGLSFDGNKLKVNAGAGLAFDSGALKVMRRRSDN